MQCEFLWVWWGGYGVIWCCVLYCVWGFSFLCVVVDLKPTASPTEPVHKPEGKRQLETQGLSIDCRWRVDPQPESDWPVYRPTKICIFGVIHRNWNVQINPLNLWLSRVLDHLPQLPVRVCIQTNQSQSNKKAMDCYEARMWDSVIFEKVGCRCGD